MAQFARPDSTILAGTWAGTTSPLHTNWDEAVADDTDTSASASGPVNDLCEVGLSDVTDPVSSSGHVIRFRHRENGAVLAADMTLRVRLLQGATQIVSQTFNGVGTAYVTSSIALTGAQADAITDYTNLRLEFMANQTAGTARRKQVSWAEFEVPDAPAGAATQLIVNAVGV